MKYMSSQSPFPLFPIIVSVPLDINTIHRLPFRMKQIVLHPGVIIFPWFANTMITLQRSLIVISAHSAHCLVHQVLKLSNVAFRLFECSPTSFCTMFWYSINWRSSNTPTWNLFPIIHWLPVCIMQYFHPFFQTHVLFFQASPLTIFVISSRPPILWDIYSASVLICNFDFIVTPLVAFASNSEFSSSKTGLNLSLSARWLKVMFYLHKSY